VEDVGTMISANARHNRRNPTEPEVRLWRHLSRSQLGGYKFRRQHPVGDRILDFFCASVALGVEIDGDTHDAGADRTRDAWLLHQYGIIVQRFSNADVMANMDGVLDTLLDRVRGLASRWPSSGVLHPNPSSEEEGLSS
jgi:very-short-patch-repair endonuclease